MRIFTTPLSVAHLRDTSIVAHLHAALTDPWRRVILRKVRKSIWEVLDEFSESILDTVIPTGGKGIIEQWGKLFRAPTIDDYKEALLVYDRQKVKMDEIDHQLMEYSGHKHLHDKAFESL